MDCLIFWLSSKNVQDVEENNTSKIMQHTYVYTHYMRKIIDYIIHLKTILH